MIFNEFRLVGDWLHGFATLLLICKIIKTRSCHSVSGLSVLLYAITFSCRYLDLYPFPVYLPQILSMYNIAFKIYFLLSSYLILYFVYGAFKKTHDRSHDKFPIHYLLFCAALLTCNTSYDYDQWDTYREWFWRFSIYLEAVAIVPQLSLTKKQVTIDKTMTYYLMMLGSYRALYIFNWIYRYQTENYWEPIAFFSGCVQTLIYLHFFVRSYPQLAFKSKYQPIEVAKNIVTIDDIKKSLDEKQSYDMPLIHNVV